MILSSSAILSGNDLNAGLPMLGIPSLIVADDSTTSTSVSPAASSSKGAGTNLGVPARIAGLVLGLLVMVTL